MIQQNQPDRVSTHVNEQRPSLAMTPQLQSPQHQQQQQQQLPPPPSPMPQITAIDQHKVSDILRGTNIENIESLTSNKDLLSLHNGAWGGQDARDAAAGQDKIIRAFGELMRNMARMKTYIRPSMCKPYGKQSESLQKSEFLCSRCMVFNQFLNCLFSNVALIDTIQLVQSLRSCLPAPHIPVSSWKSEDRHRKLFWCFF